MSRIIYLLMLIFAFTSNTINAAVANNKEPPLPPELQNALPTEHQPVPETGDLYVEFTKLAFMLGLIIAFMLMIMWFLKRLFNTRVEQMNLTSLIKILERRTLSPKTSLYIVEVNDRRIVFAESHNGVTVLSHLPSSPNEADLE